MSTAIARFNKSLPNAAVRGSDGRLQVRKYVYQESKAVRTKRILQKSLFYLIVLTVVSLVISVSGFLYFYNHYATIVEQRIDSGFWHTRAGIYSAPHVFRKNQHISKKDAVEILRRSGYVENDSSGDVWNGSFSVEANRIVIQDENYYRTGSNTIYLQFTGNQLTNITNGIAPVAEFEVQPELLSGRSEAKRGVNHALRYEEIPAVLRHAILTAEDQRFFDHYGIDLRGVARAFYRNFSDQELRQGGSTITQQLVKNTFLTPEKSISRKISEAFLSIALERKMSKKDIFTLYCNEIYLGQYGASGIHGVEQAVRTYFGKELKDINLTEAAAIAAMIKNPNSLAPYKQEAAALERRQWIIDRMAESGLISADEADAAGKTELVLARPKNDEQTIAPYFVDSAVRNLTASFSEDALNTNFNRRVYTTVDTQLQDLAEQAVRNQLARLDKVYAGKGHRPQAAIVALDPHTGHILAMVGGRDYRESQFNRATDARRQPGSTFKPFVYAAAVEQGLSPIDTFYDKPKEFFYDGKREYQPANYGGSYAYRTMTAKTALARSSNVVAVEVAMRSDLGRVAAFARKFGFEDIEPYPSMALGTMETTPLRLAAAYAVFANGGRKIEPTFISKIISGENNVIYQAALPKEQIISPKTAYLLTDMMTAVVERGTARAARGALGKNVVFAGKTGSSKDGWFVGYTPNLVTVAWVGFDENEDLRMTGGEAALPLWVEFMKETLAVRPELGGTGFPLPKGLTSVIVDPETGMIAGPDCPQRESAVVPVSDLNNYHCLKHRPKVPDTLLAGNSDAVEYLENTIIVAPPDVSSPAPEEKTDARRTVQERMPDTGKKVLRTTVEPEKSGDTPGHKTMSTYWESFEKQTGKR